MSGEVRQYRILSALAILVSFPLSSAVYASHPFHRQGYELRLLAQLVESYQRDHGEYPATDATSTWYEKLKAMRWAVRNESPSGDLPLDYYGSPLVYEPPTPANGNHIVIRALGENQIDDLGALDDWEFRLDRNWTEIRSEPNDGYWYKKDWPAARRRAWICAVLALVGLVLVYRFFKPRGTRIAFGLLWLGFLGTVVLPFGFDRGFGRSSASIDPKWITPVSQFSFLVLLSAGGVLSYAAVVSSFERRRRRRDPLARPCEACGYDLRGTIPAGIRRCPECGQPVSNAQLQQETNQPD
jgi:hypothetical protein